MWGLSTGGWFLEAGLVLHLESKSCHKNDSDRKERVESSHNKKA